MVVCPLRCTYCDIDKKLRSSRRGHRKGDEKDKTHPDWRSTAGLETMKHGDVIRLCEISERTQLQLDTGR